MPAPVEPASDMVVEPVTQKADVPADAVPAAGVPEQVTAGTTTNWVSEMVQPPIVPE